ncbi:leucyl/phenylalanyl-tRNA--protein transferase [Aureivirga sp. CE67]|uniref:leucyl/phenylalanyl-tRNA--protein transferase n=1 Tax=Aureivirga sp. CE67 TaxID=1788983 RepID=UPI0018C9BA72|nr:leucyl/phenylalanyl-tRNA--protein transferase [Aureivirga sp. CE67]
MVILNEKLEFPPVDRTDPYGILAIGGDLSIDRLLLAYNNGIFPWYSEDEPIIWYSPDERMVLFPEEVKISKSMRSVLRKEGFKVTMNQCFQDVIRNCKTIDRGDGLGTWITDELENAFIKLHELGIAISFEVWKDEKLVGGLYGLDLGFIFCGESMFSKMSNASKVAFIEMAKYYQNKGYELIDCQVYNNHLASLGAVEISREEFQEYLKKGKQSNHNLNKK